MDTQCDVNTADVELDTDLEMFETGQTIIQDGENTQHACKLVSGTAKVFREGDVVATIKAGEYFGAIAALTGNRRAASVIASERCIVEKISRHKFRLMIQTQPDLLDQIC